MSIPVTTIFRLMRNTVSTYFYYPIIQMSKVRHGQVRTYPMSHSK